MTHQIDFGGTTYQFASRANALAFARSHRLLFGSQMRVTKIG